MEETGTYLHHKHLGSISHPSNGKTNEYCEREELANNKIFIHFTYTSIMCQEDIQAESSRHKADGKCKGAEK